MSRAAIRWAAGRPAARVAILMLGIALTIASEALSHGVAACSAASVAVEASAQAAVRGIRVLRPAKYTSTQTGARARSRSSSIGANCSFSKPDPRIFTGRSRRGIRV
jgi:hypothetical protein